MALKKAVIQSNGVTTNYHRIAMVKIDTNQQISILLHSYVDEAGRQYELDYAARKIEGEPTFPYVNAEYLNLEYDETMCVKSAYEWLKNQPGYEGAEDV